MVTPVMESGEFAPGGFSVAQYCCLHGTDYG